MVFLVGCNGESLKIRSILPAKNRGGVSVQSSIHIGFDRHLDLSPNEGFITLKNISADYFVPGSISVNKETLNLRPAGALDFDSTYEVTVNSDSFAEHGYE